MRSVEVKVESWGDSYVVEGKRKISEKVSAEDVGLRCFNKFAGYGNKEGDSLTITDDCISGRYTDRLNLMEIHKAIVHKILQKQRMIPSMKKKLLEIDQRVISEDENLTGLDVIVLIKQKEKIKSKISEISDGKLMNSYMESCLPIVNKYMSMNFKAKEIDIFSDVEYENDVVAISLIEMYLSKASEFAYLNITKEHSKSNLCDVCGYDLSDTTPGADGTLNCIGCGKEISYVDEESINMRESSLSKGNRNNYEDKINFEKALINYQGKQDPKFPIDMMENLDKFFVMCGMMDSKYIRENVGKDRYGKRKGTSLNMMLYALKRIGLSCHYEDANLIMHKYWGSDLPDVSHLEDQIREDYAKSQAVFLKIKNSGRKSCLNAQYRLFRHLRRLGYECSPTDFKLVGTVNTFRFHELCWENICNALDSPEDRWIYEPII